MGTGDPVVLLHSGFADRRVFDDQIPVLARDFRVITPDIRGHGFSANASKPFRWADLTSAHSCTTSTWSPAVTGRPVHGRGRRHRTPRWNTPNWSRAIVVSGAAGTSAFEYTDPRLLERQAHRAVARRR
ncbi:alpha/beta fold hydrolase [Streptomyces sp. L7]